MEHHVRFYQVAERRIPLLPPLLWHSLNLFAFTLASSFVKYWERKKLLKWFHQRISSTDSKIELLYTKMIVTMFKLYCERFEPRSHFKSRLSLIVWVNVVLNRTVVVDSDWCFDNLCGSHPQSQSDLYHISWWYYTLYSGYIDLIGQLRHDMLLVICQLSHDVIAYEDL